jgi:predicted phage terminase large subunit-like protein
MSDRILTIGPQPGPQTAFLSTLADIAFYGGGAGGGKSFGLLLEPLRHFHNPKFGGTIFRRNKVQIRNEGGLWDQSTVLYGPLRAHPREAYLEWQFSSGMRMKFSHLENESSVLDWQGAEIPFLGFDELTHFSEKQFVYMLSRNRSTSGVPGYVRGTCNPDRDSWVRKWVDWYIGEDGFPIPERSGVLRYFIRKEDELIWADSREELIATYGPEELPKSFTFIPSKIQDNKILLSKDPSYLANLRALSRVERLRLLDGNWNVKPSAGMFFQREWFEIIDAIPAGWRGACRYWDKAATKPNPQNPAPDWTAGVKMLAYPNGTIVIPDVRRLRDSPLRVEQFVKNTALQDGTGVAVCVEQEPGSAGVADADNYVRLLAGFNVRVRKPTTDKITRALPLSAQAERGNVKLLRGPWNEAFLSEMENFEEGCPHDDQVDGASGAFNELSGNVSICDVL